MFLFFFSEPATSPPFAGRSTPPEADEQLSLSAFG